MQIQQYLIYVYRTQLASLIVFLSDTAELSLSLQEKTFPSETFVKGVFYHREQ